MHVQPPSPALLHCASGYSPKRVGADDGVNVGVYVGAGVGEAEGAEVGAGVGVLVHWELIQLIQ
jgi:hypothetical protein